MTYNNASCLAIHDLSGVGKCSLTIALPVLSACGVETAAMPTAILSTHTGGFSGFTYRDLTDDLLPMAEHWENLDLHFSALYSGFLGSARQTDIVEDIFRRFRRDALVVVDPVLGDGGRLYQTITPQMAQGMKRLCAGADLVVPNLTEAAYLLGREYQGGELGREQAGDILKALCEMGPKRAVLTGVRCGGELGAASLEAGGQPEFCLMEELPGSYHGTGDLFASLLVGGLLNGMSLGEASALAVRYTHKTIVSTRKYSKDFRYGPKFEAHLPELAAEVEAYRAGQTKKE